MEKGKAAAWTDSLRRYLVLSVRKQVAHGKGTDNGLKKEAWTAVLKEFNEDNGLAYNKTQIQSQYTVMKKKYSTFQALVSNSGFGWDAIAKLPTAPPDVWEAYIAVHKDAKEFRTKTLDSYDELHEIHLGCVASGVFAQSCGFGALDAHRPQADSQESDPATSTMSAPLTPTPLTPTPSSPTTESSAGCPSSPQPLLSPPSVARPSLAGVGATNTAPLLSPPPRHRADLTVPPVAKRQRSSRNQIVVIVFVASGVHPNGHATHGESWTAAGSQTGTQNLRNSGFGETLSEVQILDRWYPEF